MLRLLVADDLTCLATAPINWEAVGQQARLHRLGPLLYDALRAEECLPPDLEAEWREEYLATALRNALLLHEARAVTARLTAVGLPVILLKGAALAQTVYPNIALRPMVDLDLLVRPEMAPAALRHLAAMGYRPITREPQPGAQVAYESQVGLARRDSSGVVIELHWSLIDSPYYQRHLPLDWFWGTARPLSTDVSQGLILGPEAQLLHLCAHLMLHHSGMPPGYLLWLHDIAAWLTHFGVALDWDALLAHAPRYDLLLPLQRILPVVARDWDAPMPPDVLAQLAALRPSATERRVAARLTDPQRTVTQRFWDDLATLDDWPSRVGFAVANVFPAPAYMQARYGVANPVFVPLLYPYRWWLGVRGALTASAPSRPDQEESR